MKKSRRFFITGSVQPVLFNAYIKENGASWCSIQKEFDLDNNDEATIQFIDNADLGDPKGHWYGLSIDIDDDLTAITLSNPDGMTITWDMLVNWIIEGGYMNPYHDDHTHWWATGVKII